MNIITIIVCSGLTPVQKAQRYYIVMFIHFTGFVVSGKPLNYVRYDVNGVMTSYNSAYYSMGLEIVSNAIIQESHLPQDRLQSATQTSYAALVLAMRSCLGRSAHLCPFRVPSLDAQCLDLQLE